MKCWNPFFRKVSLSSKVTSRIPGSRICFRLIAKTRFNDLLVPVSVQKNSLKSFAASSPQVSCGRHLMPLCHCEEPKCCKEVARLTKSCVHNLVRVSFCKILMALAKTCVWSANVRLPVISASQHSSFKNHLCFKYRSLAFLSTMQTIGKNQCKAQPNWYQHCSYTVVPHTTWGLKPICKSSTKTSVPVEKTCI